MIKSHQKTLNRIHVALDLIMVVVSYVLAYELRFHWLSFIEYFREAEGSYLPFSVYVSYLWVILPGYLIIFLTNGVYRSQRSSSRFLQTLQIVKINIMGLIYILAVLFLVKEIHISRWFLVMFFLVNNILDMMYRFCLHQTLRKIRKEGYNIKHVLLVGYSRTAEGLIDRMQANPHWGYHIRGILDDAMEAGTKYRGVPVLGSLEILEQLDFA